MACNCCEAFAQAPLPSRPIARGRAGPGLLAHVLVGKYCDHLPLHRQSGIYAREKVDLHRSTLTDWVGRSTALLAPLADHIGKQVRAGPALFADDTPVKMQIGGKTGKAQTARMWSYVRDERPWCGQAPPCAWYQFSVDRKGKHPAAHLAGYKGIVHADGFTGFNGLFGERHSDLGTSPSCNRGATRAQRGNSVNLDRSGRYAVRGWRRRPITMRTSRRLCPNGTFLSMQSPNA